MTGDEFVLRPIDIERDAEKLAVMWNESDDQWPGTWTGGVPMTADMVREWYGREKKIDVHVFANEERIAGYCSFNEREDAPGTGYVGLLNVHPAYQGRSLGRRLLQNCIERCRELGFRLLGLDTWSGNLKSVPLYKKTGFFWVPDTAVLMFNFVPGILELPCARPYFERHDWYRTLQRQLGQAEDDERWEGMKVFVYRWAEDGDVLNVWVDREARTLTAVETNEFHAAAIAADIEPAKGQSTLMRWRIANKTDRPMSVSLIASGTEHLQIDHRATLTIAPGETVDGCSVAALQAAVEIAAAAPDVKRNKPVPAVRTLLIIDGQALELGTGMRPRTAVEVSTHPRYVTLYPGTPKTVHLQLRSYLKERVDAVVSLAPAPGLSADWTQGQAAIPAQGHAALPLTLCAAEGGVFPLQATIYAAQDETSGEEQPAGRTSSAGRILSAGQRLAAFSLPAGGVLADRGEKETRIENEWTRLIVHPRAGRISVCVPQDDAELGGLRESVGPPFWPSELDDKEFAIALQEDRGRVRAVLTADLDAYPGLTLRREVVLGGGPLVEVSYALENRGAHTYTVQVACNAWSGQRDRATLTVPLAGGTVQGSLVEFPATEEDIDKKPAALAERWAAVTSSQGTFGLAWEAAIVENEFGRWGYTLLGPELECKPQQWTPAGTLHVYAGPGDWRAVREHARRLAGADGTLEPIPVETRPVYGARLEPAPLLAVDDRVAARLVVDNLRSRPLVGAARLSLPQGVSVDRGARSAFGERSAFGAFELAAVTRDAPLACELALELAPGAAAYAGQIDLQTQLFDASIPVPVIRLGDRGRVEVNATERDGQPVYVIDNGRAREGNGQPVYVIDNGRTRFVVAPAFGATVAAWEENGVNHLLSPFPEQKTFGWMSPWYGGVTPLAGLDDWEDFPGKLYRESFAAQAIDLPDAQGIPWRGVRLRAELAREKLVGLAVELDYLTVGHSNVLKLIYRVDNATTAWRELFVGWLSFWQPDGSAQANVLHAEGMERKHTPWDGFASVGHWSAVTHPQTGRTVLQVSPFPRARLLDWGSAGGHLGWSEMLRVAPTSSAERVCYLALCDDLTQARRYIPLRHATG